jgi:predicted nucleotidyltransferase
MAFQDKNELIRELKMLKKQLQVKWPVEQLWLFGSWVRGEADATSDIDIMIRFNPIESKRIGLFEFFDIVSELENALGCKVDLVEKEALKPRLARYILPEAIEL